MRRRYKNKVLGIHRVLHRFFPAGNYTFTPPIDVTKIDVFCVGGGGAGVDATFKVSDGRGGGGGYTKAFRGTGHPTPGTWVYDSDGYSGRDGNAISVKRGEEIEIIVGKGGIGSDAPGGFSQFKNSTYRADGSADGNGGSGGTYNGVGGSDGGTVETAWYGTGQGHTTRDFGEATGGRNAAGGGTSITAAVSDYSEGSGFNSTYPGYRGGGGYGGGGAAGADNTYGRTAGNGGDGTVLLRYYTNFPPEGYIDEQTEIRN